MGVWIWCQTPRQKEKEMELMAEPDPFGWAASQKVRTGTSIKAGDILAEKARTPRALLPLFPRHELFATTGLQPLSDATIKVKQNGTTGLNRRLIVGLPSKAPPLSLHK